MQSAAASRSLLLSAFSSCVVTHVLWRPRFSSTRKVLQRQQQHGWLWSEASDTVRFKVGLDVHALGSM
jgi:hypothetical protein